MTTIARKLLRLNEHDNMTLEPSNLDNIAYQKNNNDFKQSTTWIFADNSALTVNIYSEWTMKTNVAFHRDYIHLNY